MRIFSTLILLFIILSCTKSKEDNQIVTIASNYINTFPIGINNYDYVIRFYKKDNDTILEINQDRVDIEYPLDLSIKPVDSNGKGKNLDYRFIKLGNIKINKKAVFIFGTTDSIGKMFYNHLKLKQSEHEIEEFSQFNYPFLPVTRIFKVRGDKLVFAKEVDTVRFK